MKLLTPDWHVPPAILRVYTEHNFSVVFISDRTRGKIRTLYICNMRMVIQRVKSAAVEIDKKIYSTIGPGFLVLLGISENDRREDADWLCTKLISLRVFADEGGKMNLALADAAGSLMVVSQFTLFADTRKGNRPSFIRAGKPDMAVPLYEYFLMQCEKLTGTKPATGKFGADMQISLINDGPVTIVMDSADRDF